MSKILALEALRRRPTPEVILRAQGIPPEREVPGPVADLLDTAMALYEEVAEPVGIVEAISTEEFPELYRGEGMNADRTPLPGIIRNSTTLALFAATLGSRVSERIEALFSGNDPALGYMLDTVASERADMAATLLAQAFLADEMEAGRVEAGTAVLPYSPGYCGWHLTGQKKLFARLEPGRIGIRLTPSCLMVPIKSVSGILVTGPPEGHDFENNFEFCLDCAGWDCRDRIASLT